MDIKLGGRWSWVEHSGEEKTKMVHLKSTSQWRLGNTDSEESHRMYGVTDLVLCMRAERSQWAGNAARTFDNTMLKRIVEGSVGG